MGEVVEPLGALIALGDEPIGPELPVVADVGYWIVNPGLTRQDCKGGSRLRQYRTSEVYVSTYQPHASMQICPHAARYVATNISPVDIHLCIYVRRGCIGQLLEGPMLKAD